MALRRYGRSVLECCSAKVFRWLSALGWQFLTNAFNRYGRTGAYQKVTFYGDTFGDKDEIAWAAAALYAATGDPASCPTTETDR